MMGAALGRTYVVLPIDIKYNPNADTPDGKFYVCTEEACKRLKNNSSFPNIGVQVVKELPR